ncbi:SidA/IucD/PvdA family monooxygenase [Longispora albida]|uniref:SidA/IucD/PvdA family monooxygenase n=1 Tax=Longispora albida TaxID=203523 RepID=UPI00036FC3C4|nr:SidA/IucD/PvdA family monooxygenase [Longispora albida]
MPENRPPDSAPIPFYDTVGIGAGPAGLSLAALFGVLAPREIALFDAQAGPGWHSGMLHPGVRMQTGWVKDLVSLLDPTHPLSLLNYLVTTGKVYALVGANFDSIPRLEYTQYLAWAAAQIPRLTYSTRIDKISVDDAIVTYAEGRPIARSEHLVLGQGTVAHLPEFFGDLAASDRVIVADVLADRIGELPADLDAPIVVIGGGQTSAECAGALLGRGYRNIRWIGRRSWFAPLEDSPAANDLYRPSYQEYFVQLPAEDRKRLVADQLLTSDGITPGTLRDLYQVNYEGRLREGRFPMTIMPGREVTGATMAGDEIELVCQTSGGEERLRAAYVVVAAGRRNAPMPFDEEMDELIDRDDNGDVIIEADYSLRWKYSDRNKIFVLNRGRFSHGLVDSNVSILPIRSAIIINSLAERKVFNIRDEYLSTQWA